MWLPGGLQEKGRAGEWADSRDAATLHSAASPRAGVKEYICLSKGTLPITDSPGKGCFRQLGKHRQAGDPTNKMQPLSSGLGSPESRKNNSLRVDEIHISQRALLNQH